MFVTYPADFPTLSKKPRTNICIVLCFLTTQCFAVFDPRWIILRFHLKLGLNNVRLFFSPSVFYPTNHLDLKTFRFPCCRYAFNFEYKIGSLKKSHAKSGLLLPGSTLLTFPYYFLFRSWKTEKGCANYDGALDLKIWKEWRWIK